MMRALDIRARLGSLSVAPGSLLTFGIAVYALANYWYPLVPLQERAIFAALTTAALFLVVRPEKEHAFWRYTDVIHALLALLAFGYVAVDWQNILMRQGAPTTLDIYLGAIAMYLMVVACMRNFGAGLTAVVLFFLVYTFFGWMLPNWAGGHRGYSIERIFTFLYISENGVLGFAIDTCLKYMFLFLMLGKVLEQVGALGFIMDLSRSLFGSGVTGPPLMAVGSSALIGTMTGSSMSNVYIAGTVTIPLMKRVGLKPEVAAAIEAAASNGSQIMPPVMGFAVFFMVVLLDTPYVEIMIAAAIPGTLYFVSLFFSVWLRARRLPPPTGSIWDSPPPPLSRTLFSISALCFFGTLGALIALLVVRYSVQSAVLYAVAGCIIVSWLGPRRFGPVKAVRAAEAAGRDLVVVSVICLALGLITGPILLTGLGTKLPALLLEWSQGHLWLLLVGSFIACMVLGAGIPTSMAYVIVALLVASAMATFGVPKLAGHLFVFYAALAASITPPVALTAYVAATLAGADFWKTGWHASFLGIPKYLVPFGFIYRPELLMNGEALSIVFVVAITTAGLFLISYSSVPWRYSAPGKVAAALLAGAGFLLSVPPITPWLLIAAAIAGIAGGLLTLVVRRQVAPPSGGVVPAEKAGAAR